LEDKLAQKVQVVLVDDLDGGTADETVSFSLDGAAYEIDLTTENAQKLRDQLAAYVGSARRVGGRGGRGRSRGPRSGGTDAGGRRSGGGRRGGESAQIREWARNSGYQVSERGRISAEIRDAYTKANR
jgi:hypothetical protein